MTFSREEEGSISHLFKVCLCVKRNTTQAFKRDTTHASVEKRKVPLVTY